MHDNLEIDFAKNCLLCLGKNKCGFLNKKILQSLERNLNDKQKALYLVSQFVEQCPCSDCLTQMICHTENLRTQKVRDLCKERVFLWIEFYRDLIAVPPIKDWKKKRRKINMNNVDVTKYYKVKNNTIVSPGKFEGEHVSIPYFWEIYLMGGADIVDEDDIVISILEEDVKEFPDLKEYDYVVLNENTSGFVYGTFLTLEEYEQRQQEKERENEENEK